MQSQTEAGGLLSIKTLVHLIDRLMPSKVEMQQRITIQAKQLNIFGMRLKSSRRFLKMLAPVARSAYTIANGTAALENIDFNENQRSRPF